MTVEVRSQFSVSYLSFVCRFSDSSADATPVKISAIPYTQRNLCNNLEYRKTCLYRNVSRMPVEGTHCMAVVTVHVRRTRPFMKLVGIRL
jgi:hypothetical protein